MIYFEKVPADRIAKEYGTPVYIYEESKIREAFREIRGAFPLKDVRIHYAIKANSNPWILRILLEEGAYADTVSPGEIFLAMYAGFPANKILFTQNSVSDEEMSYALERGIMINVESLSQLKRLGKIAPGSTISVRFNIYVGAGHHSHVITGGPESKFGIDWERTDDVKRIAKEGKLQIKGVHCHIGSGILDSNMFVLAVKNLFKTAKEFSELEFIDFGGGIGVPYRPEEREIDIKHLGEKLSEEFNNFCQEYGSTPALGLEPGRFLVARAGSLLCRVTSIKEARKYTFVGTNTGFNHLVRPAFYGSFHYIEPAEPRNGEAKEVAITGNLCESGDVFTRDEEGIKPRKMPPLEEGDLLVIRNVGAYGFTMASHYNSFLLPPELLVNGESIRIIRYRENFGNLILNIPQLP